MWRKGQQKCVFFLSFGIMVVVLAPLAFIQLRWGTRIQVDPPVLAEEYLKFLGRIVAVYFGFILVHVIVANRQEQAERKRNHRVTRQSTTEIVSSWDEYLILLSQSEQDRDAAVALQGNRYAQLAYIESEIRQLLRFLEAGLLSDDSKDELAPVRQYLRKKLLPRFQTASYPLSQEEQVSLGEAIDGLRQEVEKAMEAK